MIKREVYLQLDKALVPYDRVRKLLKGSNTKFKGRIVKLTAMRIHRQKVVNVKERSSPYIEFGADTATVALSVENVLYWYPLYFYYDWIFDDELGDFVLECLTHTPRKKKKLIRNSNYLLSDWVDYLTGRAYSYRYRNGKKIPNMIYEDNMAICADLIEFSRGNITTPLSKDITQEDIARNFQFIFETIDTIQEECYTRYLKYIATHKHSKLATIPKYPENFCQLLYKFASDEDLRVHIKMGAALRLTHLMDKAYRGR